MVGGAGGASGPSPLGASAVGHQPPPAASLVGSLVAARMEAAAVSSAASEQGDHGILEVPGGRRRCRRRRGDVAWFVGELLDEILDQLDVLLRG